MKNSAIKITAKDSKTKEVLEFEYKSKTKLPTFFRIYNGNANKNADLYMTNNGTTYFKIPTAGMKAGMDSEYNMNVKGGEQFQESLIPSASEIAALRAKQVSATTRTEVKSEDSSSESVDSSSESVDMYHHIIKGANLSDLGRTAKKCIDDVLSCAIL